MTSTEYELLTIQSRERWEGNVSKKVEQTCFILILVFFSRVGTAAHVAIAG